MARLRWTTIEDDEEDGEARTPGAFTSSKPTRRKPLRPRASSTSSDSDSEPIKGCATPRTPANRARHTRQLRLVHLNSLKKFSRSPAKSSSDITKGPKTIHGPRAAPRSERHLTTELGAESLCMQHSVSSGDEIGFDAEQGDRCGSRDGIGDLNESDGESAPSNDVPPHETTAPRIADAGGLQSLLELSNNLQSLKIIDDCRTSISDARSATTSDKENHDATVGFSPPRSKSPAKKLSIDRPVKSPPASPTKSRLLSPSKKATRVPSPPGRPSLDTFWDAEAVNAWNDRHSPQKPLRSPRKPAATHQPPPSLSPQKTDPADRAARKLFETTKHALATAFLAELDQTITAGQIHALSASTGGVKLVWSPTLTTTAGRASWRQESRRVRPDPSSTQPILPPPSSSSSLSAPSPVSSPHPVPTVQTATAPRHFATIELASKVIDSPARLHNTLAHEFCHLANFMISGVRDRPHGSSFRAWGSRVSTAFADRGVEVTTTHAFKIEYKYVWRCSGRRRAGDGVEDRGEGDGEQDETQGGCGTEYGRHSKSIDPRRQRCGACRGELVQVRPAPRGKGPQAGGDRGEVKGYAAFVKANFASVKAGLPPGASHKKVMETLGAKYRAERGDRSSPSTRAGEGQEVGLIRPPGASEEGGREWDANGPETGQGSGVEEVVNALEVVVLSDGGDDDDQDGRGDGITVGGHDDGDALLVVG